MPQNYKILGQVSPSGGVLTSLYTVPSATQAICSTLVVCNTTSGAISYRLAARPTGEAIATKHYLAYDSSTAANDSILLTLGITLSGTDVFSIYASTGNVAFSLFGTEII